MNPTESMIFEWAVKLMNTAAFVYLAACFFFIFAVSTAREERSQRWSKRGSWMVMAAFTLHTSALLLRWYIGGISRPPWTNLYESLVFFAWGVSLFQVYAQSKWNLRLSGVVSVPLIFILMGMSVLTPNKGVEPLIPALQSYWLKIHVVFGMLAYAGFTTAGCIAFLQLMRNGVSLSRIACGFSLLALLNLGIAGGKGVFTTGRFEMAKTTYATMPNGQQIATADVYREYEGGPVITRMEEVPHAAIPYLVSLVAFAASAVAFGVRGFRRRERLLGPLSADQAAEYGYDLQPWPQRLFALGLVSMLTLFGMIGQGVRTSETLTLHSNPYLTMLLLMTFFFGVAFVMLARKYRAFLRVLPSAERLDELSYTNILFAFPFQTLLLVTGAVWAFYAWGRSWGWDPKETWALITWFAFLIYLHGKLLLRWKPNLLSVVAIFGFVILVFAFLGVNLVLSGLHSYGSA
ncbi:MAG: cytochrome c biogenesis protein CcsA [Bdellovibrionales bacterium]|nr:cytochrome c biogenesis protein CcsA [Bdellovibrionales bacterium]